VHRTFFVYVHDFGSYPGTHVSYGVNPVTAGGNCSYGWTRMIIVGDAFAFLDRSSRPGSISR
jgi:hypothetical protein